MKRTLLLLMCLALLMSACGQSAAQPTIRFAYLPIVDSLPLLVAQKEGLFEKNNVHVQLVPVNSAPERDQLMQTGQIDGVINELLNAMQFNKDGVKIQVVRYALMADAKRGHFFVLASKQSGITEVAGLKGVDIGISQATIIEYVTTRLLEGAGFAADEIRFVAIPKLPDRLALVLSGEAKAVVLPDPLASIAISKGAVNVIDDTANPVLGASVYSLSKQLIDSDPAAAKAFLKAIDEAMALINADPTKYRTILGENKVVPPDLLESFTFPAFPAAEIPSQSEWDDVAAWASANSRLATKPDYAATVIGSLLK